MLRARVDTLDVKFVKAFAEAACSSSTGGFLIYRCQRVEQVETYSLDGSADTEVDAVTDDCSCLLEQCTGTLSCNGRVRY